MIATPVRAAQDVADLFVAAGVRGILLTNQIFSGPFLPPIHQDFWTSMYTALP